jgi:hypothetical protein
MWLPVATRPERRGKVWRWGTGGEGRRHRARWSGTELTRGATRRCSTRADSNEERWARTCGDSCSGGAAPGSLSLAMEWTARPEELGADHCMGRHLSASSARRGGVRLGPERVSSGGAKLRLPLGAVGGFTEKEWGERGGGSRLDDVEARRGKKKGRGFGSVAHGGRGGRPWHRARGEGGTGPGAAVPGGRRAHDALGRERERRSAGRWAAWGVGPSGRERESKGREGDRLDLMTGGASWQWKGRNR